MDGKASLKFVVEVLMRALNYYFSNGEVFRMMSYSLEWSGVELSSRSPSVGVFRRLSELIIRR